MYLPCAEKTQGNEEQLRPTPDDADPIRSILCFVPCSSQRQISESAEERSERLAIKRLRASQKRINETHEQQNERVEQQNAYATLTRSNESELEMYTRLARMRIHANRSRARETTPKRCARLENLREHASQTRTNESEENKNIRLERDCQRHNHARMSETEEERNARLRQISQRLQQQREAANERERSHNNRMVFIYNPTDFGEFRQILPVVKQGTRANIVNASLKTSDIWRNVTVKHLTTNMRVQTLGEEGANSFSELLLQIGEGRIPIEEEPDTIIISDRAFDQFLANCRCIRKSSPRRTPQTILIALPFLFIWFWNYWALYETLPPNMTSL
eukprot:gene1075-416_t